MLIGSIVRWACWRRPSVSQHGQTRQGCHSVYADAAADLTDPTNWSAEVRLTDESFDLHDAFFLDQPGFRRGYFIGDYEGLASDGRDFLTLFIQPGEDAGDHGSVFFRRLRATGQVVIAGNAEATNLVTLAATPLPFDSPKRFRARQTYAFSSDRCGVLAEELLS